MNTSNTFLTLALLSAIWGIASSIRIVAWLKMRGEKISFVFLRLYLIKYVHRYRVLTQAETGSVGPLFYHFVIGMNLALLLVIAGLAAR